MLILSHEVWQKDEAERGVISRTRHKRDCEMMDSFIDAGEKLMDKFNPFKACEGYMRNAAGDRDRIASF